MTTINSEAVTNLEAAEQAAAEARSAYESAVSEGRMERAQEAQAAAHKADADAARWRDRLEVLEAARAASEAEGLERKAATAERKANQAAECEQALAAKVAQATQTLEALVAKVEESSANSFRAAMAANSAADAAGIERPRLSRQPLKGRTDAAGLLRQAQRLGRALDAQHRSVLSTSESRRKAG